jgi:protein-S-isoprenylcysteine O-methyltransferase Ste14
VSVQARPARLWWFRFALTVPVMTAFLFLSAGRIDWYGGWALIALVAFMQVRLLVELRRVSPDLLKERSRMQEGTKPWDKVIMPLIGLILPSVTWLIAGLNIRFGWTAPLPPAVQVVGFVLGAAALGMVNRAMIANRFFALTVRIQSERGHCVVSAGPYEIVRHPGYVGMAGLTLATPLALGSLLSFIPAGVCVLLFVVRTALEDRTLRAELPGYAEYARRVRWRLIPGLW